MPKISCCFGISVFSESVFTQCRLAGARRAISIRKWFWRDMGHRSSSHFTPIFIEVYGRRATLSLSITTRTDTCKGQWERRAVATDVWSFSIILCTAYFWYQRQEGIWLQLTRLEMVTFWTPKQMDNLCCFTCRSFMIVLDRKVNGLRACVHTFTEEKVPCSVGNRTPILQVISFALLNYNGSLDVVRTGRIHTELQLHTEF
jgi:hypothetical protein